MVGGFLLLVRLLHCRLLLLMLWLLLLHLMLGCVLLWLLLLLIWFVGSCGLLQLLPRLWLRLRRHIRGIVHVCIRLPVLLVCSIRLRIVWLGGCHPLRLVAGSFLS